MLNQNMYKRSSTGKVQIWTVDVCQQTDGSAKIIVVHGQLNGKLQVKQEVIKEGKNIGKSNETTPYTQALLEANSKYNKQVDKGYTPEMPTDEVVEKFIRPMLAHRYDEHREKMPIPCYVQPKLDGLRCLSYIKDGQLVMESRKGKPFTSLLHIAEQLKEVLADNGLPLDGELYVHDTQGDIPFQKLCGLIKRDKSTAETLRVEYHIYDVVDPSMPMTSRLDLLRSLEDMIEGLGLNSLKIVNTQTIKSFHDIEIKLNKALEDGYEGIMLRRRDAGYEIDKRSYNLLKVKKFIDEEFEVIDVVDGKGTHAGLATFVCCTKQGYVFNCTPEGTEAQRREYYENKQAYIGKMLTVRYFEMTTSEKPVPRFPVGVRIREVE